MLPTQPMASPHICGSSAIPAPASSLTRSTSTLPKVFTPLPSQSSQIPIKTPTPTPNTSMSATTAIIANSADLSFGAEAGNGSNEDNGQIDEVRVYNLDLSRTEIIALAVIS